MPDDGEPREADDGQAEPPAGPEDEGENRESVDDGDEHGDAVAESDPRADDATEAAEDDETADGVGDGEEGSADDDPTDADSTVDDEAVDDPTAADQAAEDSDGEAESDDESELKADDGEKAEVGEGENDVAEDEVTDDGEGARDDDAELEAEATDDDAENKDGVAEDETTADEDATDDDAEDEDGVAEDETTADEDALVGDTEDEPDVDDEVTAEDDSLDGDAEDEPGVADDDETAADEDADRDDESVEDAGEDEELPTAAEADGDDDRSADAVGNGGVESDGFGGISTPPDDEEMPLADHIEEMISRLAIVLLIGAAGTALGILWAADAIDLIWSDAIPEADEWPPHLYHPLELWLTRIKVAGLLGIMVALPMFVYQCYRFMRPGLYPHERKYYLAAVPTSVVLAGVGMLFSYLVVLPILFEYFTFYSEGSAEIHYALGETFNLVITLTAFLAIVFQIPLLIMMAVMMGVVTRRWLADKRLYFWAAFFGLAFMFTIDPTAMAAIMVAIVMIVLFEGTLLILKWVGVD